MEMVIRPCHAKDAAALSLVAQATFLEAYADYLPVADILSHCEHEHSAARYAGWLAKAEYGFWVGEIAGKGAPVGYIMLCPPDLPVETRSDDVELKRIYLLSRFQGLGWGARLMDQAVEAARKQGARRLLLGVNADNTNAIAFYARQGFTQAGVRKFQVGANTYDDLVLARAL